MKFLTLFPSNSKPLQADANAPTSSMEPTSSSLSVRLALILSIAFGLLAMGCGNTLYLVQVHRAEQNFQEAKELGAEQYAPYEYYAAKARLEEARRQAAQAEYGNAADLSDEATVFSNKAIQISKKSRMGDGTNPSGSHTGARPAPATQNPSNGQSSAGAQGSAESSGGSFKAGGSLGAGAGQ